MLLSSRQVICQRQASRGKKMQLASQDVGRPTASVREGAGPLVDEGGDAESRRSSGGAYCKRLARWLKRGRRCRLVGVKK